MNQNDAILSAEQYTEYVDTINKTIGVKSDYESSKRANNSRAVCLLLDKYGYKIQMLIPD